MKRGAFAGVPAFLFIGSVIGVSACAGSGDSTSSIVSSVTAWNGSGPNPCAARNPVALVPVGSFTGDQPNPSGIRRASYAFSLPVNANACVLVQVEGSTTAGDRILVDVDD